MAKDGRLLYTVRGANHSERVARVSAASVSLVGSNGNCFTLQDYLANAGKHGAYAGLPADADLCSPAFDEEVLIRFQTTVSLTSISRLPKPPRGGHHRTITATYHHLPRFFRPSTPPSLFP